MTYCSFNIRAVIRKNYHSLNPPISAAAGKIN